MGLPHGELVRDYRRWVALFDTLRLADRRAILNRIKNLTYYPLISVVMPVYNVRTSYLVAAIESVIKQLYQHWELCIADDASTDPEVRQLLKRYEAQDPRIKVTYRARRGNISAASNSALRLVRGEFVAFLDNDDILSEQALYRVVEELNRRPNLDLIYSDEDKIDQAGKRFEPHFKPDWNQELFYVYNYICHLTVIRHSLVKSVGGFRSFYDGSQDYDLLLRLIDRIPVSRIHHIPSILYHWRATAESTAFSISAKPTALLAARKALQDHFAKQKIAAEVHSGPGATNRVIFALNRPPPKVSCIICTRDRVVLLKKLIDGLLSNTDYDNLEIIVIDNESSLVTTKKYLNSIRRAFGIKILRFHGPFNYSAMNNLGSRYAKGSILALLNNDLQVVRPCWLKHMVRLATRPDIGAVGAKLLYEDNRVQHGGVIVGLGGLAGHAHRFFAASDYGYFYRAQVTQAVSAVTGACLVVRRDVFERVGGFDEEHLKVAFNDVDLCLRIRQLGFRNIWTPDALLVHRESASRGSDLSWHNRPRFEYEAEYFRQRWQSVIQHDPAYNPNLTCEAEDYSLAFPPRVVRPWKTPASCAILG